MSEITGKALLLTPATVPVLSLVVWLHQPPSALRTFLMVGLLVCAALVATLTVVRLAYSRHRHHFTHQPAPTRD